MQQSGKKREPTLKEMMAAQGKLSRKPQQAQPQAQPKPAQVAKPAAKPRTEEEKKQQVAELAKAFGAQMPQKQAPSKEDKLRDMINENPEMAAELLRQMFLK